MYSYKSLLSRIICIESVVSYIFVGLLKLFKKIQIPTEGQARSRGGGGGGRVQLIVIVLNTYVPKQNKVMCPSIHHRKCHNHRRTNCNVRSFYIYSNGTGSLNFGHYAIIHSIILSSLLLSKMIAKMAPTNNHTSKSRIEQYKGATKSELCTSH